MTALTLRHSSNLLAAAWMAGWLALMLGIMIAARESARELNTLQIMELRSTLGFLMLLPLVYAQGGLRAMKTDKMSLHIMRNVAHYGGQSAWLLALTMIPLSQLIAIEFTMPIWTAILAAYFLKERFNRWKICAIILGILGVLLIVRPTGSSINPGQLIILAGAVGFGISVVAVKALTRTDSPLKIIFWMLVIQSVIGFIPALLDWHWPSLEVWGWILIVAFCGSFSHYCMARALVYADTMIIVPLDFLRLPLSAVLGWLVYAEALDVYTAGGALLILLGNFLNLKAPRRAPSTTPST